MREIGKVLSRCAFSIRATLMVVASRECVAHQYHRLKNVRAAPTYVYSQRWRRLSLMAHALADCKVLSRKAAKARQALRVKLAGFLSHAYFLPVNVARPLPRARDSKIRSPTEQEVIS